MERGALRAALVGCGAIAVRAVIPGFLTRGDGRRASPPPFLEFGGSEGLSIEAICDPNPRGRERARRALPHAREYADFAALQVDLSSFDALLICTPPQFHETYVLSALRDGLDVFVEKPIAADRQGLERIVRAQGKRKLFVMVHLPWRFRPEFEAMRQEVAALAPAAARTVRIAFETPGLEAWGSKTAWHREEPLGCLVDLGTHAIDLASSLLDGEPLSLRTESLGVRWKDGYLIQADMWFEAPGGGRAEIRLSWGGRPELSCEVEAVGHRLRVDLMSSPDPGPPLDRGRVTDPLDAVAGGPYREFVRSVLDRRRPATDLSTVAAAELAVLDAAAAVRFAQSQGARQ